MADFIFCQTLGLDVEQVFRKEPGECIVTRRSRVSVVRGELSATSLTLAREDFGAWYRPWSEVDILALVKNDRGSGYVAGWIGKEEFQERHRVADDGAWFMPEDELHDITTAPGHETGP